MQNTRVIRALRTLVDGDQSCRPRSLRGQPHMLDELQSICAVETASTVIPALHRTPAQHTLSNTDTFTLSATDPANEVVSNLRVHRVRQTEDGHDDIAHVLSVLLAGDARHAIPGSASECSEPESVPDSKLGKMDVGLGVVNDFAAEVVVHHVRRDALILDVGVPVDKEAVRLAGDGFQEGRTTAARE